MLYVLARSFHSFIYPSPRPPCSSSVTSVLNQLLAIHSIPPAQITKTKSPTNLIGEPILKVLAINSYNSLRPSMAFNIVTSSAYSKSAPTGIPTPIRVTRTPSGFKSFDK